MLLVVIQTCFSDRIITTALSNQYNITKPSDIFIILLLARAIICMMSITTDDYLQHYLKNDFKNYNKGLFKMSLCH